MDLDLAPNQSVDGSVRHQVLDVEVLGCFRIDREVDAAVRADPYVECRGREAIEYARLNGVDEVRGGVC